MRGREIRSREAGTTSLGNSLHQNRIGPRPHHWRRAMQVGLHGRGASAEACAVDLQVLHDTLHVVARLGERDALYPIDRIDLGIAWITMLGHPFRDSATASIVTG